jgi:hypothetical protein
MQNKLVELTKQVEDKCPVGDYFGVQGVGEGIVWVGMLNNKRICFKVKGEKHTVSKVKTLASVSVEKVKNIKEFIEYAVTDCRMDQGYDELFTKKDLVATNKDIGLFVNWVKKDVLKEESDTLSENGLDIKDIARPLSDKARKWLQNKY